MLREFTDTEGTRWRVWEVNPTIHDRPLRSGKARGFLKVPDAWLCFQSGGDRRRLTPVPRDWDSCDPEMLENFCSQAEAVRAPDRRLGFEDSEP
jgi:hypothetical protein